MVEVTANRGQPPRRKASARSKPSLFRGELFRPTARYVGLIVLHSMSGVVFRRSGSLAASVLAMLVEITCHVVFIAFNWQLWNEIYLTLQVFVMSFL